MALVLNEEQQLLKESAEGFFADKAPITQLREIRDGKEELGYRADLWQEMSEMGFAGLLVDEDHGGTDFGVVAACLVAESMGRTLVASPYLASSVIAASVISLGGSDQQKASLLPAIASGEKIITLAADEKSRHAPLKTEAKAVKNGDGYTIKGMKTFVPDGHVADQLIVMARTSGETGDIDGLSMFLVDRKASGVVVDQVSTADSRNWARVSLEGVSVGEDALVGEEGKAVALERGIDIGRIVIAAELLGISEECLARIKMYLQERKQFGVLIGTFQGLQHRASHLFTEIEVLRSAVLAAAQVAETDADLALHASMAKAKACQVAELATNEAVQMHGGMGMTDEFDMGLFMKRARTLQHLYGDFNYHADRFARYSGY